MSERLFNSFIPSPPKKKTYTPKQISGYAPGRNTATRRWDSRALRGGDCQAALSGICRLGCILHNNTENRFNISDYEWRGLCTTKATMSRCWHPSSAVRETSSSGVDVRSKTEAGRNYACSTRDKGWIHLSYMSLWPRTGPRTESIHGHLSHTHTIRVKKSHWGFLTFSPKRFVIFSPNFTTLCTLAYITHFYSIISNWPNCD